MNYFYRKDGKETRYESKSELLDRIRTDHPQMHPDRLLAILQALCILLPGVELEDGKFDFKVLARKRQNHENKDYGNTK